MKQQVTADGGLQGTAFIVAGWSVDPTTLRICKLDKNVKLEPKVMAVLECLAVRPGQVVSRQQLEDSVWAGTVVGYDAISNAIIKLRKAFGDDAHHAEIIETIPKAGYRLIAAVEVGNDVNAQSQATPESVGSDQSIIDAQVVKSSRWRIGVAVTTPLLIFPAHTFYNGGVKAGFSMKLRCPDWQVQTLKLSFILTTAKGNTQRRLLRLQSRGDLQMFINLPANWMSGMRRDIRW